MAAGRHGGYRDNEFRDREADFLISRKEIGYSTRIRRGDLEYERGRGQAQGQVQGQDSLDHRSRVRQKDIREREVMNGGHRSTSSRSHSGSSGGAPRRCGFVVRPMDREPGELSSDGSDGAMDSESQVNKEAEVKMLENGGQLSPVQNKKRKFSPIIWDRDDREVSRTVKSRNVLESSNLPPPPPLIETFPELPNFNSIPDANIPTAHEDDSEVHISEASPSKIDLLPDLSEVPVETSSLLPEEEQPWGDNQGTRVIDDDDYLPARTIISSRWANDADSPADEGEISDYEDKPKLKRKSGSESAEVRGHRKSISPELGEVKREGSEGARGRFSGSDERVRSSSRDSYHENDDQNEYMELDDNNNYNGSTSGQSDTESEDDRGSSGTPEPSHPPQRSVNMLQGCRSVDEFERLNKIDEGTYGVVYRARDKKTGEIVALKKVKMEKEREGFPLTSLREINILLSFHHPSIVDVKEVVVGSSLDSIFMVMEYMEHDLKGLMETMKQPFSQSEVKCLMLQLLGGIKYLHDNWVLHRDLKTSNLLLNNRGELKICDFGLARQYGSPLKPYTHLVVTLWYRAPELLLGAKQYSTAIDMWSLGCIMAELLSKEPLFNGKTEVDQLDKIFKILGTPNETIWPGLSKLHGAKVNFVKHKYNLLRKKFPATSFTGSPVLSDAGFDLLNKLLTYDPEKRITAEAALNHEWFREVPLPKSKEFMPTFPAQHAQDRRMRRVMKSPDPLEEQRRKELQQGELGTAGTSDELCGQFLGCTCESDIVQVEFSSWCFAGCRDASFQASYLKEEFDRKYITLEYPSKQVKVNGGFISHEERRWKELTVVFVLEPKEPLWVFSWPIVEHDGTPKPGLNVFLCTSRKDQIHIVSKSTDV
ncbi:Cyclin-dependent kinase G-2 [Sesamum alatum]|uniref:cyclin-dependent kinase n=1 Tax=Sesamum alatum TaxID=300844 RepID=A0AAE2CPI5_9LAMI|nr:Cyclin-dependent kinase G-2 [Sesamum alatum]